MHITRSNSPSYASHLHETHPNLRRCCDSAPIKGKLSADNSYPQSKVRNQGAEEKIHYREAGFKVCVSKVAANIFFVSLNIVWKLSAKYLK